MISSQLAVNLSKEIENKTTNLILIEGLTRSGKTTLSKRIESINHRFLHIDVADIWAKNGCSSPDISHLIKDKEEVYIIDDAASCQTTPFLNTLKAHLNNGGAAIVMVQNKCQFDHKGIDGWWYRLTRSGLSKI